MPENFVTIITNGTRRVIPADEPVFLIRGQDVVSGAIVRAWANLADDYGASHEIVESARELAAKMDSWPKKKTPDLPANAGTAIEGDEPVSCCESCGKPLFEGDLAHRGSESLYLCRDCAPTYRDLQNSGVPFSDPDDTEMSREARDAVVDAHLAAGGSLDDKMISTI